MESVASVVSGRPGIKATESGYTQKKTCNFGSLIGFYLGCKGYISRVEEGAGF